MEKQRGIYKEQRVRARYNDRNILWIACHCQKANGQYGQQINAVIVKNLVSDNYYDYYFFFFVDTVWTSATYRIIREII